MILMTRILQRKLYFQRWFKIQGEKTLNMYFKFPKILCKNKILNDLHFYNIKYDNLMNLIINYNKNI